jgi:hypothetical protein
MPDLASALPQKQSRSENLPSSMGIYQEANGSKTAENRRHAQWQPSLDNTNGQRTSPRRS